MRWKNLASHGGRLGELAVAYGLRLAARLESASQGVQVEGQSQFGEGVGGVLETCERWQASSA